MNAAAAYATVAAASPETLVENHAPLVKRIANHLKGRLPENVDLDDLIQVGLIALLEAARQFSSSHGASFETYAGLRVRGAMLDEVRRNDWVPRSVYRRQRELAAAIRAVENRTGRPAGPQEIADELGVGLEEYFRLVGAAATMRTVSLDQAPDDDEGPAVPEPAADGEPSAELEGIELQAAVARAIGSLPEREALVMALYYDEELNLKEIGEVLGVTESRVCQLHGQALARIRGRLGDGVGTPARAGGR